MLNTEFPFVSIILLNFNNDAYTTTCINSIYSSKYPNYEVIVVDNGSNDDGPGKLTAKFSERNNFKLLRNSKNLGFAEGNNIGVKDAKGDIIFILNNDTEIKEDCLSELVDFIKQHQEAGVVQSKILELKDRETIQLMGSYFAPSIGWTFPLPGRGLVDAGQFDSEYREVTASGAALAITRSCYEKIGLFDADYFICYEDLDVSLKAFLAGYKTLIAPISVVYHHDHKSNVLSPFQRRMRLYVSYRNCILTIIKDFELKNVIRYLSTCILFSFVHSLLYSVKNRDPYGIVAFIRAVYWNLASFPKTLEKRRYVMSNIRSVPDNKAYARVVKSVSILELIHLVSSGVL